MLTLTRPHRQVLGTVALLLATVAPTVFVGLTAWRINRPGHVHDVEAELGKRLGMKVTLEAVRYPRPGEAVCTGLVLWQPEPRQKTKLVEVARADRVKFAKVGGQVVLSASGLRLSAEGPGQAVAQVGDLLRRAAETDLERVSLAAEACELSLGPVDLGPAYSLTDLAATFRADAGAPALEASYRLGPGPSPTRCELKLVRDRQGAAIRTTLALRTADGPPLPAQVLAPFFDPADWLGPEAKVAGSLALAQEGSRDWEADFAGEISDVALGSLLGDRVPDHQLSGRATLSVKSAHWGPRPGGGPPGWVSADGRLAAGAGSISTSLLKALRSEMSFRLGDRLELKPGVIDFQGLGLAFSIRPDGAVQLAGDLGDAYGPGAVILDADGLSGLAFAPRDPGNLIGLRRTLGPADASQAILVPTGLQFLDYLPMPARAPSGRESVAN
jgi:hypothetical protein